MTILTREKVLGLIDERLGKLKNPVTFQNVAERFPQEVREHPELISLLLTDTRVEAINIRAFLETLEKMDRLGVTELDFCGEVK